MFIECENQRGTVGARSGTRKLRTNKCVRPQARLTTPGQSFRWREDFLSGTHFTRTFAIRRHTSLPTSVAPIPPFPFRSFPPPASSYLQCSVAVRRSAQASSCTSSLPRRTRAHELLTRHKVRYSRHLLQRVPLHWFI